MQRALRATGVWPRVSVRRYRRITHPHTASSQKTNSVTIFPENKQIPPHRPLPFNKGPLTVPGLAISTRMNDPWIEGRYGLGNFFLGGGLARRAHRYGVLLTPRPRRDTRNADISPLEILRAPYRGYIATSCVPSNFSEKENGVNFLRTRCVRMP
jgi:hypothetical protein